MALIIPEGHPHAGYQIDALCASNWTQPNTAFNKVNDVKYWEHLDVPLSRVPPQFRTREICLRAYNRKKSNYKYIPQSLITDGFIIDLLFCVMNMGKDRYGKLFARIPIEQRTSKLLEHMLFVQRAYKTARWFPARAFTADIINKLMDASTKTPVLEIIPESLQTVDLCRRVFLKSPTEYAYCTLEIRQVLWNEIQTQVITQNHWA
ncbi:hypothetical protein KDA11_06400, partial [Candidatus Saccharibacteria bacterium]|nr:hypothetical protein [Candidatus Saccharibacteria bacterium]